MSHDPDEHINPLAPMQGVMFGACVSAVGWLVLYLAIHVALALWRAHHP